MYRPPSGTKLSGTDTEFYSDLDLLFTDASISAMPVVILGDFNVHFNDIEKSTKLRNILNDYDMQQHVVGSTHKRGNTLDLVITPKRDNFVLKTTIHDYVLSDHYTVECIVQLAKQRPTPRYAMKRPLNGVNMDIFNTELREICMDIERTQLTNINDIVQLITTSLNFLLDKHAPKKRVLLRTKPHPWYDEEVERAKQYRRICERFWRLSGLAAARQCYVTARNSVTNLIKKKKTKI